MAGINSAGPRHRIQAQFKLVPRRMAVITKPLKHFVRIDRAAISGGVRSVGCRGRPIAVWAFVTKNPTKSTHAVLASKPHLSNPDIYTVLLASAPHGPLCRTASFVWLLVLNRRSSPASPAEMRSVTSACRGYFNLSPPGSCFRHPQDIVPLT